MPGRTQQSRDRGKFGMDRKSLDSRQVRQDPASRNYNVGVTLDADIGNPSNWSELVDNVQRALDNIVEYLLVVSERETRFKDEDGRIVQGGLGESCIIGINFSPAVVTELQRIGDAIGANGCLEDGTFVSKTDEQWKRLNRT